ncbi:SDR family NAD(P)-dependent oxidoreductase [Rhizobium sp. L1K21]|uniref:SDR family NAD(P)-dependent oxidoreductase n=1 Tax=Rhizobium sp. L1K21 TaxID=2954933 RepID=UPI002092A5BF|nr:SDR family NAD(P)-dependent oxidoreductase [Rhizobium sp. L1K21]MCO6185084.1 SDR family NAD(P)-dependent oxidoreductase [Rhizobium sp. L1K21]
MMRSLCSGYKALVIGASGGIGAAVADCLERDLRCDEVFHLSRRHFAGFDLRDPESVAAAASHIQSRDAEIDLIFNATGALIIDGREPEKSLKAIDADAMAAQFAVNAIGPALLLKHFHTFLPRGRRSIFASVSARVGSIGDNRLGGWYSYRASKAAQNQIIRTAAVEIARLRPKAVVAALHPGTVKTSLSDPFAGQRDRLTPRDSAARMLTVLDGLESPQSGGFFAYDGSLIEW